LARIVSETRKRWGNCRKSGTAVGMVFVHKSKGVIRLHAVGEIGIAAGDENKVAPESTFLVDGSAAIDFGVEAIVFA
jgi:hypothetical protein